MTATRKQQLITETEWSINQATLLGLDAWRKAFYGRLMSLLKIKTVDYIKQAE